MSDITIGKDDRLSEHPAKFKFNDDMTRHFKVSITEPGSKNIFSNFLSHPFSCSPQGVAEPPLVSMI